MLYITIGVTIFEYTIAPARTDTQHSYCIKYAAMLAGGAAPVGRKSVAEVS